MTKIQNIVGCSHKKGEKHLINAHDKHHAEKEVLDNMHWKYSKTVIDHAKNPRKKKKAALSSSTDLFLSRGNI